MLVDRERKVARALAEPTAASCWGLAWGADGPGGLVHRRRRPWARATSTRWTSRGGGGSSTARRAVLGLVDTAPDGRVLFHRALDRYGSDGPPAGQPRGAGCDRLRRLLDRGALERRPAAPSEQPRARPRARGPPPTSAGRGRSRPDRRRRGSRHLSRRGVGARRRQRGARRGADRRRAAPEDRPRGAPRRTRRWMPPPRGGMIVRGRERPDEPLRLWLIDEGGSKPRVLDVGAVSRDWAVVPGRAAAGHARRHRHHQPRSARRRSGPRRSGSPTPTWA